MPVKHTPLDFSGLTTYSLFDRPSKVNTSHFAKPLNPDSSIAELLESLPRILLGCDFPELIDRVAQAHEQNKSVIVGMGAHVIKVGLSPLIIDLMQKKIITGLALNGACVVHDFEIALVGATSEEVSEVLGDGSFGAAHETGHRINEAINAGARENKGMGEALGEYILANNLPNADMSILAAAFQHGVPCTVHVAIGTDIIHIHPSADGGCIGKTSHLDFRLFCKLVSELEGGAYLNFGSAVVLPEVFLKALTLVRNLGYKVNDFTTANFDFIRHYRPLANVITRPTASGGKGINVTGHHELMIPLFVAALLNRIKQLD